MADGGEWSTSRHGHFTARDWPQDPLNSRLGGTHSLSERYGVKENFLSLPSLEPRIVQRSTTQSQRPTKNRGVRREASKKRGQGVIIAEQRSICWVGLRKTKNETSVRMTGLQAKIWTRDRKVRHPRCVFKSNVRYMYTSNTTMSSMLSIY
jgi:hypothetical protein